MASVRLYVQIAGFNGGAKNPKQGGSIEVFQHHLWSDRERFEFTMKSGAASLLLMRAAHDGAHFNDAVFEAVDERGLVFRYRFDDLLVENVREGFEEFASVLLQFKAMKTLFRRQ